MCYLPRTCSVHQSKTPINETLPSRTKELQAMRMQKLRVTVELLTGHKTLRPPMFKLGLAQRQECRLRGDKKEDGGNTVYQCPVLACKRHKTLGCTFLKPKDLENMRVNGLVSLVANPRSGIITYTQFKANK